MLAQFQYRTFSVPLELRDVGAVDPELRVACPLCGKRCRLNPEVHSAVVDHAKRLVLSIHPVIRCPGCEWRVVVSGGIAFDVAAPAGSKTIETSHTERQRTCRCGRQFSSKSHDECQACRGENEYNRRGLRERVRR